MAQHAETPDVGSRGVTLEVVAHADLERQWQLRRAGVANALERSGEAATAADVKRALDKGLATMMLAKDSGVVICTLVVQRRTNVLHIWTAHGIIAPEIADAIEGFARKLRCKQVSMDSNRKGWSRRALRLGYTPRRWVKDL